MIVGGATLPVTGCRGLYTRSMPRACLLPPALVVAALLAVGLAASRSNAAPQGEDSSSVVTVTVMPGRTVARPGEVMPIAIVLDHKPKWHTQASRAGAAAVDADAVATGVVVTSSDPRLAVHTDGIQWPTAHTIETKAMGAPTKTSVYSDRAIIYVPVEIAPNATAGNVAIPVALTFQACDDKVCLQPVMGKTFEVVLAVDPGAAAGGAYTYPELFAGYRPIASTMPVANNPAAATRFNIGLVITGVIVAVGVVGMVVIAVLKKGGGR